MLGNTAFRVLLARALALAKAEVPWLRTVQINPDGSLEGLHEIEARAGSEAITEAEVVLLAHLLELLVAFIGETLSLRIVRAAWPQLPLRDVGFVGETRK